MILTKERDALHSFSVLLDCFDVDGKGLFMGLMLVLDSAEVFSLDDTLHFSLWLDEDCSILLDSGVVVGLDSSFVLLSFKLTAPNVPTSLGTAQSSASTL